MDLPPRKHGKKLDSKLSGWVKSGGDFPVAIVSQWPVGTLTLVALKSQALDSSLASALGGAAGSI